ncbi:hypothetical protein A0H81_02314 [Grifola frondosa]|uniref:Plasma membrane proteolipid 3 n=1 Tax=Grifola frondosa TaxID=5627 RepID=A0A1C7MMP8_GRIFR|nr:hypothetical protein A0H81_02314 [Grifola frondosa]
MTPRRAACDLTIRCDDLVLAGLMGPLSPLTPLPEYFLASTQTTPRQYNLRSREPPFDPEHQAPIIQSQSTERALVPDAMYGSVLSAISIGVIEPSVAALSREASIASQNSSRESSLEPSQASQASTLTVIEEESEFFGREPRIKDEWFSHPTISSTPLTTVYDSSSPNAQRCIFPSDVVLYFIAIFIPPLAVFFKRGLKADFWINICLWILGWIPGIIHAWWIISRSEGAV